MGLFRLLLAIAVVGAHSPIGFLLGGGTVAVQSFYMISGFYIAMILDKTPAYQEKKRFYFNRFLRIYPVYATVALLTLIAVLVGGALHLDIKEWALFGGLPWSVQLFLGIVNVMLLGQDGVMFLGLSTSGESLVFLSDFRESIPQLNKFLLVPQAWSIGVELMFYLIAPFLLKRSTSCLLTVMATSFALRALAYQGGLDFDPWTYRFFPFELGVFLAGVLSYRWWTPHAKAGMWGRLSIVGMCGLHLLWSFIPLETPLKMALAYGLLFFAIPWMFEQTRHHRWDRYIGDLSYPVYIGHLLVILVLWTVSSLWGPWSTVWHTTFNVAGAIAFGAILKWAIQDPVDRLRDKVRKREVK